jgi:hypothetical protein
MVYCGRIDFGRSVAHGRRALEGIETKDDVTSSQSIHSQSG